MIKEYLNHKLLNFLNIRLVNCIMLKLMLFQNFVFKSSKPTIQRSSKVLLSLFNIELLLRRLFFFFFWQ